MSTATTGSVAVRLNLATITQYLSSQSSLAGSLKGDGRRRAVLLRSAPHWDGPAEPAWGEGRTARIVAAPSPLAVHELVLGQLTGQAAGPAVLVVLTDREQHELDPAILARTHKRRIDAVDSWDVVRDAFGAQDVDGRLRADNWAAEALLDATPPGGWHALAGGMLSRRSALSSLALRRLRLGRYGPDAPAGASGPAASDELDVHTLLGWSLLPSGPERLLDLRGPERSGLVEFLAEEDQAGLPGRALLGLVLADHGPDAVAFGLVCAALWVHAVPDAGVYQARGRAERWFGEQPPATGEQFDVLAAAFGRAAEEYVSGLAATARSRVGAAQLEEAREARRTLDTVLDRASALVRQFGAEAAARRSPVLQAGLDEAFTAVGRALARGDAQAVARAITSLHGHVRAEDPHTLARIERTRMALRLAQWLACEPAPGSATVAAAIERHLTETGWVDRAVEHVEAGGDPDPELRAAYDRLTERVRTARKEIDRDFAGLLAAWTAAGTPPNSMLTLETFLDRVVKPVVRGGTNRRVLLLVLDGMSAPIATELGEELRSSWAEFDPLDEGDPRRRAVAAVLPTVTAVCRTSLFAGRLLHGTQNDEKQLFPELFKQWAGASAAVFHKDDLRADSAGHAFGPELTEALTNGRTHVAVVLNAIDDRLAKEQKLGDGSWQAAHIPGLSELLRVAATEGMAVILTSDHGHVVDRHGAKVEAASPLSARHRAPGGETAPAEVVLSGPRVVAPESGGSVVALWDADSRYTARKAGYHGGASLAEFAVPVLAFLSFGAEPPAGWRELGNRSPAWWETGGSAPRPPVPAAEAVHTPARPVRQRPTKAQAELAQSHDSLFDVALVPAGEDSETLVEQVLVSPDDALVEALFAAEAFQSQLELLARKPPKDKLDRAVRALLDAGTLPVTALAQRVDYPATRADGFAAILRQLLNFDGVQVLETLTDGRTVRLDSALLKLQFDLG
ncbi:BREX-2 system phosphatase PglZ [Streptomyces sp. NPDC056400]|uniref:BREX-2 system phosphatase PglZ n=1 Tax=Streptomyces sp. NPDC056400 TaxID=3345808 RepID=UPI0035D8E9AF